MSVMPSTARRMFELLEPICLVTFFADESNEELAALGHRTYWDGYFASRAAPLGRVPAEVVDAAFYSFADGEVARHIPSAWDDDPARGVGRRSRAGQRRVAAADPRRRAGRLPRPGARRRPHHQGCDERAHGRARDVRRACARLPVPEDPVARLWHSATMLREHRGDGHIAALVGERIGGTEAHVLSALDNGIHPAESFGRIHHLPKQRLAAVMDGLRERGLVDADGRFTDAGRETKHRIEALTDELARRRTTPSLPPSSTSSSPSSSPSPRRWWRPGRSQVRASLSARRRPHGWPRPFVADDRGLARYSARSAISSGSMKRCSSDVWFRADDRCLQSSAGHCPAPGRSG